MPFSRVLPRGAQGPVPQDDPMDALSTLLSGGTAFDPNSVPYRSTGGNRNNAIAGAMRGKYGLGADTGDISQSDLEALDSFVRGGQVSDKIATEVAPERVKGEYGLASDRLRGDTARDVENIRGGYGVEEQAMHNRGLIGAAQGRGGQAVDEGSVNYLAEQATRDASLLTKIPMAMRPAVLQRMSEGGADVNTMTNQTRQMSETANDLLPMIHNIETQAQDLQKSGNFDLVSSPLRQFFVKHGMGTLLGYGDDAAGKSGQFQTDLGLLQSGVARAHAGARGAGNSEMAARFEQLMNAGGDLPTFLGQLKGVRDLLTIYGQHTNPSIGGDPYANPNYQPR